MQVGDLVRCVNGGLYIVSAITQDRYRDSYGEVAGVASYADLIDAVTLETGAIIRIDNNPYVPHYEIVSSPNHSRT
jgi:hypothetical protein